MNNETLLKANVGEWSEMYVFFRLLATGKMDIADDNLVAIPNEFYKILAILRKETKTSNEYLRSDDCIIIKIKGSDGEDEAVFKMSIEQFASNADRLLENMQNQSGRRTAGYPEIQSFMRDLRIYSIKDVGHKRDITISLENLHNGLAETLGFSIKSFVGKQSTLFNAGAGTNFVYQVRFPEGADIDCDRFNEYTYDGVEAIVNGKTHRLGKISYRLKRIYELSGNIVFDHIQSDCLTQNLRIIDGELPRILAEAILTKYSYNLTEWSDIIMHLNRTNPLNYRINADSNPYEVKIKRFLQDAAMGMTPETEWNGHYDATGGQIVVKKDGEIVCYHIYELNRYLQYLFNSTRFEQPATSEDEDHPGHVRIDPTTGRPSKPFQYGWLYKENGKYFIKINLQIRFK